MDGLFSNEYAHRGSSSRPTSTGAKFYALVKPQFLRPKYISLLVGAVLMLECFTTIHIVYKTDVTVFS
jgi:hypothetical protein